MPSVSLPHDEAQLAVGLQVDEAVDDVDAGRLQAGRPLDVVALVEPRLQLDEHRHLLAGLGGLDQQVDQRRVRADAVQRHLDGDDVRVLDGRAQERLDRGERLERVVDQEVLIADLLEDLVRSSGAHSVRGANGGSFSSGRCSLRQLHPVAEAQPIRGARHHVVVDLEVLDQDVQHARAACPASTCSSDSAP